VNRLYVQNLWGVFFTRHVFFFNCISHQSVKFVFCFTMTSFYIKSKSSHKTLFNLEYWLVEYYIINNLIGIIFDTKKTSNCYIWKCIWVWQRKTILWFRPNIFRRHLQWSNLNKNITNQIRHDVIFNQSINSLN